MADNFNPKLRPKFLRDLTKINNTAIVPGNWLVDMSTGKMYIDVLASDGTAIRRVIGEGEGGGGDSQIDEADLISLTNLLNAAAEEVGE